MSEVIVSNSHLSPTNVEVESSYGEGTVRLRVEEVSGDLVFKEITGDISLEGPWLHAQEEGGRQRTFPAQRVIEVVWKERQG